MLHQLQFFFADYEKICGRKKVRYFYAWMNRVTVGILLYRFERGMYLSLGGPWKIMRMFLLPLLNLLYAYANTEIHYEARIGPGISVLHASPGVVISAKACIGRNITLVGGNIIGSKEGKEGQFTIGDNCYLGANSVVLGPITIGSDTVVGACALVIDDYTGNGTLIGVPARPVKT